MFSKQLVRGGCAVVAAALLGLAGGARAADVVWDISGTFNDGATLTGTVTIDQYGYLLSNFSLTTTKGSAESGFTYTAADSYFSTGPTAIDFQPGYKSDLHLQFADNLGVAAAIDPIVGGLFGPSFECVNSWSCPNAGSLSGFADRYLVSGEATLASAVPEPATWAMLLVGVGGLGAALRTARRRERAAAVAG